MRKKLPLTITRCGVPQVIGEVEISFNENEVGDYMIAQSLRLMASQIEQLALFEESK